MTDQLPHGDTSGDDASVESDGEFTTSTPLWVKLFGIIVLLAVVVLIVILLLVGGHDPGGHS